MADAGAGVAFCGCDAGASCTRDNRQILKQAGKTLSFTPVLLTLIACVCHSCVSAAPQIPYSDMTPLQAAVGVVQKGLRPALPQNCPAQLAAVMSACWDASPLHRPSFKELTPQLQLLLDVVREEESRKSSSKGGLLSKLNLRGGSSKDGVTGAGARQQ